MSTRLLFALLSCGVLGLRHGFDYDHLAAITDITGVQRNWREGMRLGLLYALGHALTVAVLGVAVLLFHISLPASVDAVGERLVGLTLIVLAVYVLLSLLRRSPAHHHAHMSRSRIALLVGAVQHAVWRLRRLFTPGLPRPDLFAFRYDRRSVFVVGILHGIGAETPSQLLLFLLAANLGGPALGVVGLGCFVAGLLVMNTLMTASASGLFTSGLRRPGLGRMLTAATCIYSFAIGTIFLFGISDRLPPLVR